MRPTILLTLLPLLLLATPVLAARTATISGTPTAHVRPDGAAEVTHHVPSGATVTVEQCTSDAAPGTATTPGAEDWCLLRGVGWVRGQDLVNLSMDPTLLLPEEGAFDPLKDPTPSWDDLDAERD